MWRVPYVDLSIDGDLKKKILDGISNVLTRGQYILGEEVKQFEQNFASLVGRRFAVAVNSGLDALIISLRALGIGAGDEVITVANSFVATVAAVDMVGAIPVFVDVGSDRNMNPLLLESVITKRTKAIIPVHLAGHPADMKAIRSIAGKYGLWVLEDAAQAVGAQWQGEKVGNMSDIAAFSLHPLKNLEGR
ncbi:DegT/DnrJ/EryC1/StrS aminotransferase family protein [Geobacillus sp. C56-T3]|uniref:DegT/DnrJ/EryC1/StrS family aminotransferase n=1 Tax=Geobacillus sp. (strain C56-T3) TaxID=691437 RepID=UPI0001D58456|nr:aminotransferase class V-fold PLP-dependent enzyme [Geobacillus sp. C56-T3]ADI27364.1 DegT/DnrJ/EryC1/StrS aminotransferase [Geobacillus sp. C56-T3]